MVGWLGGSSLSLAKKKITVEIVATNVVSRQLPELRRSFQYGGLEREGVGLPKDVRGHRNLVLCNILFLG